MYKNSRGLAMHKILIIAPSWVGDAVMSQCLFKTIKRATPAAEIVVLARPFLHPVFARMPEVADILPLPFGHGEIKLRARRRLGRELRAANFTQSVVLPGSFKSALIPFFAKIPRRTGYVGEQRYGLLNDRRVLHLRELPMQAQRFVALGLPKTARPPRAKAIPPPALQTRPARAMAAVAALGLQQRQPITALCPGAEYGPAKRWPAEYFAAVADSELRRGRQIWIFGGENDRAVAAEINGICGGKCADLTGRTALGEAVDLLSLAATVVTNDSGLMHIAAAVGARIIAVYGASSDAFTPPLDARAAVMSRQLACRPCFQRTCPLGHYNCLNQLRPEKIIKILAKFPPPANHFS